MGLEIPFSTLEGKTLTAIENRGNEIIFTTSDGEKFRQYHDQDCCEVVIVEDVVGDLEDLIGSEIIAATESSSNTEVDDSTTWTFYNIGTIKGWVTIRWNGNSNGYYSESVSFEKYEP